MNVEKLKTHNRLYSDLLERMGSDEAIARLSEERAFDEWLGWTLGDRSWGSTFRDVQKTLKNCADEVREEK